MKFGLVEGKKSEAIKGAKGTCPNCGAELVARCGDIKINHWAHKGKLMCDIWWENETEWHRAWKNNFPVEWQEVIHFDQTTGEKHIADIKTSEDWVLEFQHSPIKNEEVLSRNSFYKKIIWIVDGLRRKWDIKQLNKALEHGSSFKTRKFQFYKIDFPDFSRLLMDWSKCGTPVFFDFNEDLMPLLFRFGPKKELYLMSLDRGLFIDLVNFNQIEDFLITIFEELKEYLIVRQRAIDEYNNRQRQIGMNRIIARFNRKYRRGRRF